MVRHPSSFSRDRLELYRNPRRLPVWFVALLVQLRLIEVAEAGDPPSPLGALGETETAE